ncbi:uncharacterized protein NMK_2816 [Novimethylophilus kurashikiensis]|uniref:Uncharacterized protein n=1 Tax=Novimethylophilus kurashikiensis TaxID=1825523 RepID=A0A2R5FES7_9PROT|nr:uncharacterized protein NMK_2816 [Novimethylophilus kurashikiensis]
MSVDAKTGTVSVSDLSVTVSTDVHSFKITATATAQDGTAAPASNSDTVHVVSGTVGDDALQAGTGDSILVGGAGNDTLVGGAGNDILVGSSGDDLLTGGKGSNAFVWKSGETGSDTITDFKVGDGGDVLNLSDVLHGEHSNAASLDNYLTFSINKSGDTVISIHADGAGSAVTQTITLQGVDLVTGHDSTSIINNLLGHGNLKADA